MKNVQCVLNTSPSSTLIVDLFRTERLAEDDTVQEEEDDINEAILKGLKMS